MKKFCFSVSFKVSISILIFSLDDLSVDVSDVRKFSILIMLLLISFFIFLYTYLL